MTLTEMRYLVALVRERHFGRAAQACHVSQPTLSVAIKKVEGQLGAVLRARNAAHAPAPPDSAFPLMSLCPQFLHFILLQPAPLAWCQIVRQAICTHRLAV